MIPDSIIKTTENGLHFFERNGVLYFEMYIQCPICIQNSIQNVPVTYWEHSNDGGQIFIGDNGKYICKHCEHEEVMVLWGYNCPIHDDGTGTYMKVTNAKVLAKVIGIGGMIVGEAGIDWLQRLLPHIKEQWADPKYK